ncbi:extracellular solute-binding protein [Herbiconiux sp. CPCC 205763]|uniref:Extracellular solute-binding protein n=1 Tax=Herbiconiux aconitum TaxID=2970913 RepID=A0ABT2GSG8_9MICO|nr:extracellular solute-binding protein [Herbiconiux aconitum]MCS5719165.1 extracellular solute-binding protein [Herbiconiux aconitum]
MKTSRITTLAAGAALLVMASASLTACSSGGDSSSDSKTITVWSEENQPDRVNMTKDIIAGFTEKTGIKVDLVPVDDTQVAQLTASAALSGKLPDVMGGVPLSIVRQFQGQGLLNTDAAATVIKELGPDTFVPSTLALDKDGDSQLAVPDSAFAQVLVYRKDLFAKAGLNPPTTYDDLKKAAKVLTADGNYGITLATDPSDVFTSQTFESLALGNDCQLVDKDGTVGLDSDNCQKTWDLYADLAQNDSPEGTQTVDTTRASYFAGQAAMVDWSTYILDELAGLRNDALPTCPECQNDPTFLAKNSGIVTSITGPDGGEGSTYGEAVSWVITKNANVDASTQFVEYMMNEGYLDWLGMAPEGKFPLRTGDATDPAKFTTGWTQLQAGVDTKKTLSEVYDADTIAALQGIPAEINRWAIPQGQGALLGPVNTELPIAKAVADLGSDSATAKEAAQSATDAVQQLEAKLTK